MEYIKLSNNVMLPKLGMGTNTFGKTDNQYHGSITYDISYHLMAINNGYRMFDTAISYRNEALVGQAIKASRIPRSEFFVISKIPARSEYILTKEQIRNTISQSLKEINLEYIDLYLIHHPIEDKALLLNVWEVMEEYYDQGLLKAIGVSNFNIEDINFLIKNGRIAPMVNQIEINQSNWNYELIKELKEINVVPQTWSPLKRGSEETKELLEEIGKKYNKSWAQVLLKFNIENDICVIAKSHTDIRQKENMDIFDFKLTKKDFKRIEEHLKKI